MQKIITLVRVVTVVSYFLPFTFFCVTCNKGFGLAYSKKEWAADEAAAKDSGGSASVADSAAGQDSATMLPFPDPPNTQATTKLTRPDTMKPLAKDTLGRIADTHQSENIFQALGWLALVPAVNSESGIGVLFFYKDPLGKIVVSASILLSLAILVTGFFKRHNKRLLLAMLWVALLCMAIFMVDAFIQQVDLLFGAWVCVCSIIAGLALQYRAIKNRKQRQ